ncbi:MAG TPA: hypothetical protein VGO93_20915 [Candidatus Xenobia bacterium]|jgi:hypothetical protein
MRFRAVLLASCVGYLLLGWANSHAHLPTPDRAGMGLLDPAHGVMTVQRYTLVALVCLYWSACRLAQVVEERRAVVVTFWVAGILCCLALPTASADAYAYLQFGRLAALYHLSPWVHTYASIHDNYSPLAWYGQTMIYGPVVYPEVWLAGYLSQWGVAVGLLALKFVHLCVLRVAVAVAERLAAAVQNSTPLVALALNPIVMVEIVVNGHNDAWLILAATLLLSCLATRRAPVVVGLAAAGVLLVKISGLEIAGLAMGYLLATRGKRAFVTALVTALLTIVSIAWWQLGHVKLIASCWWPSMVFQGSIPTTAAGLLAAAGPGLQRLGAVLRAASAAWIGLVAATSWYRIRTSAELVMATTVFFITPLFLVATYVFPWYLMTPMFLVPLLPERHRLLYYVACGGMFFSFYYRGHLVTTALGIAAAAGLTSALGHGRHVWPWYGLGIVVLNLMIPADWLFPVLCVLFEVVPAVVILTLYRKHFYRGAGVLQNALASQP